MLKCESCGHEQSTGRFCGKCGSPIEESTKQVETEHASTGVAEDKATQNEEPIESVIHTENIKTPPNPEDLKEQDRRETTEEIEQEDQASAGGTEDQVSTGGAVEQVSTGGAAEQAATSGAAEQAATGGAAEQAATSEPVELGQSPTDEQTQSNQATAEIHDQTAEVKEHIQNYWSFVTRLLKNPTKSLELKDDNLNFSLINYILLSITYGITFVYLMKNTFGLFVYDDIPYTSIFFGMFVFSAIISLSAIFGTFLIAKICRANIHVKEIITKLGGLITPVIVLQIGTILFALGGSFGLTIALLFFSILFAYLLFPSLLIFQYSKTHINGQRVYLSAAVALLNSVFIYIIIRIVAQSLIAEIVSEFSRAFRMF